MSNSNLKLITDQIKEWHINELKSLKVLPPPVANIMKAVMVIFNKPETYIQINIELNNIKRFISKLKNFSENINH